MFFDFIRGGNFDNFDRSCDLTSSDSHNHILNLIIIIYSHEIYLLENKQNASVFIIYESDNYVR